MFRLHIYSQEGDIDETVEIPGDTVSIGRSSDCDVVLERADVSRRHVELRRGIVVEDLGSRNGTHVNGERIEGPTTLSGTRVQIGDPDSNPIVIEILESSQRASSRPPSKAGSKAGEGSRGGSSAGRSGKGSRARRRPPSSPGAPPAAAAADPLAALKAELAAVADSYRRQRTEMQRELEDLRSHLAELRDATGSRDAQAAENERLRRRIAELERDRR